MKLRFTVVASALLSAIAFATPCAPAHPSSDWRTDPAWLRGEAEWALYDAMRVIYDRPRYYEATVFTNKQHMDPRTTVKTDTPGLNAIPVFKQNVSEIIPTEHYAYRFLTTCFVRTDSLQPYKIVMSSQEDCGATYRQMRWHDRRIDIDAFCYFPDAGQVQTSLDPAGTPVFHDALMLTLRSYPFTTAQHGDETPIMLVEDFTSTRTIDYQPRPAVIRFNGIETIEVPFGRVECFHLIVERTDDSNAVPSDYWFAVDPALRHVLVQYEGANGQTYGLKRLAWWAYWKEPMPEEDARD